MSKKIFSRVPSRDQHWKQILATAENCVTFVSLSVLVFLIEIRRQNSQS